VPACDRIHNLDLQITETTSLRHGSGTPVIFAAENLFAGKFCHFHFGQLVRPARELGNFQRFAGGIGPVIFRVALRLIGLGAFTRI
jgi:hypothetical protein